jgi:zinc/manganese transport system permease protein
VYIVDLMAAPFAECLVLVAIHTYLGIHVLKRRVIFVDLALAQIAALGTTVGFLFGIMPDTVGALIFSMAFTFLGAAVFSVTRFRHEKVPQEAIIGLTYAIACAVAVMVVEKTKGVEHLKDILVGNLLWVKWFDVGLAAAVYALVGGLHVLFRKQFVLISNDPEQAFKSGIAVRAWDFLFYLSFGVVITLSTRVAGVLLVFVFLVAPAILAFLVTGRLWLQLLIGWATGTVVTVVGLVLSWKLDLPSGPAVIGFYGVALVVGAVAVFLVRAPDRFAALRSVFVAVAVTGVVVLVMWATGRWLGARAISTTDDARRVAASVDRDQTAAIAREAETHDRRKNLLLSRTAACVGGNKVSRYLSFSEPEERLAHAKVKIAEDQRRGLEFITIALADDELPLLYREETVELLRQSVNDTFGYDPELDFKGNQKAVARLCEHVRTLKRSSALGVRGAADDE